MTEKELEEAKKFVVENRERFEEIWNKLAEVHPEFCIKLIKNFLAYFAKNYL